MSFSGTTALFNNPNSTIMVSDYMKKKELGPHDPDGEYEIKFWKDWLHADPLKRMKMVEKLSLLRDAEAINDIPLKRRNRMFAMLLNSFFEDLESAVYTKVRLESKAKRK